jgi:hypothetical protein
MVRDIENHTLKNKRAVLGIISPMLGFILGFNLKPKQRWALDQRAFTAGM